MDEVCKTSTFSPYAVISELISTVYNLSALAKCAEFKKNTDLSTAEKIKKWLTIIEYCETCLELIVMSVSKPRNRHGGSPLKWTIVSLIQLTKCAGRMILLLKYKEGLLPYPPLQVKRDYLLGITQQTPRYPTYSYVLKSGRLVRSVREVYSNEENADEFRNKEIYKEFDNLEMIAEAAYIVKPVAHLAVLYFSGRKSWKPWMLSLALDIASLSILFKAASKDDMPGTQKKLIFQRRFALLAYLLRSPFYDRKTRQILEIALYSLEMYVPCTSRFIVRPTLSSLSFIQQIYFYLWSH